MKQALKAYTQYLVNESWFATTGHCSQKTSEYVNQLEDVLRQYQIESDKDKIVFAGVVRQNKKLSDARRDRVNRVQEGLPWVVWVVWVVLFIGATVVIVLTWFLVIANIKLDIAVNNLCGALIGSLIFLIAAMDNPFRGEYSVSPEPYQLLSDRVMKK